MLLLVLDDAGDPAQAIVVPLQLLEGISVRGGGNLRTIERTVCSNSAAAPWRTVLLHYFCKSVKTVGGSHYLLQCASTHNMRHVHVLLSFFS